MNETALSLVIVMGFMSTYALMILGIITFAYCIVKYAWKLFLRWYDVYAMMLIVLQKFPIVTKEDLDYYYKKALKRIQEKEKK